MTKLLTKIQKFVLNARLDSIAWALFLIMIGVLWMLPEGRLPEDTWLLGVGIILLGLNAVRRLYNIKVSYFTVVIGILALFSGLDNYIGFKIPIIPILIIILGLGILIGPKWLHFKMSSGGFEKNKEKTKKFDVFDA